MLVMSWSYLGGCAQNNAKEAKLSTASLSWGGSSSAIGLCFAEENPEESRAKLPVNHKPQSRHHQAWHNSGRIHQRMEQQNVDDNRPSDGQRQRNGSWKKKQHPREQLQPKYKHQVVRCKHDREILLGQFG